MRIVNKTANKIVSEDVKLCKGIFSKARGMMFSKPRALIFVFEKEKIVSLHMLFVFFPIDVVFLDKNKKVAEIKENLMPFSFYTPKNKAKYIIEVPKNTIKRSQIELRHKIDFK